MNKINAKGRNKKSIYFEWNVNDRPILNDCELKVYVKMELCVKSKYTWNEAITIFKNQQCHKLEPKQNKRGFSKFKYNIQLEYYTKMIIENIF